MRSLVGAAGGGGGRGCPVARGRFLLTGTGREEKRGKRMNLFFQEKWEVEGLQTVGILLVVCSSLKLMHFLGLIDITTAGKTNGKRAGERRQVRSRDDEYGERTAGKWGFFWEGGSTHLPVCVCFCGVYEGSNTTKWFALRSFINSCHVCHTYLWSCNERETERGKECKEVLPFF